MIGTEEKHGHSLPVVTDKVKLESVSMDVIYPLSPEGLA